MPLPIALAGGRLLTSAVRMLMKRYGLKKLAGKEAQALKKKAIRNETARVKKTVKRNARKSGATPKEARNFARESESSLAGEQHAIKNARRKQVGGNIAGDIAGGGLSYELYSNPNDLEEYVKNNKPRVWAKYKKSGYSSLKEYLKDRA